MKKIIISLCVISAVAAIAVSATRSFFSDTETSTGNTFTAGTIDIAINDENPWEQHFDLGDLKPGETGYINFDIQNVGQNPVNVSKHLGNFVESTGSEQYPCVLSIGSTIHVSSEPECVVAQAHGSDVNDVQSQIIYDLSVEVYAQGNDTTPIGWQTIYTGAAGETLSSIYPDGGTGVALGMIPAGGHMKVTQSYHFNPLADNEYQGDKLSFDITIKGEQIPQEGGVPVAGPTAINLRTAGDFAILAKTAVTTTGVTGITGDIGVSPNPATSITGFGLVLDSTGCFSKTVPTNLLTGNVYAADYNTGSCTTPAKLTTAVSDMETAYTNAAGQPAGVGPNLNLGGGTVATQTLAPGVYTWGSNVTITGDITLNGSATDVWIFQISGTLGIDANKKIILSGGALPQNIFWQVADAVTLKPGSHFKGNILAQTNIAMQSGASLNGRALAQTAVTLIANTVTLP